MPELAQIQEEVTDYRIQSINLDKELLAQIQVYPVDLHETEEVIQTRLKELAVISKKAGRRVREIKDWFEQRLIPIRTVQKDLTGQRSELLEVPDKVKRQAGDKAIQYQNELQRRIREENERIRRENEAKRKAEEQAAKIAEKHGIEAPPVHLDKEPIKYEPPKQIKTRTQWDFEIEKFSGVQDDILLVYLRDSGKRQELLKMAIREIIRKAEDPAKLKIDGVRIFSKEIPVM